jgi:hypothetical protein
MNFRHQLRCESLNKLKQGGRLKPVPADSDHHGRAYSCWPGESVTRGDRRRRELALENSSPPLAGQHESTARLRLRIGH